MSGTTAVTIGGLDTIIADEVRRLLAAELAAVRSPWLNAVDAADYIRCPVSRVRKLTSQGVLPKHQDGGRVLYHRDDLDAYIRKGGARCC